MKRNDYLFVAKAMSKARDGVFRIEGKEVEEKFIKQIIDLIVKELLMPEFDDNYDYFYELRDEFLKTYEMRSWEHRRRELEEDGKWTKQLEEEWNRRYVLGEHD